MASIQGIYLALFGRPADPIGLAYYNDVTKNGADLSAIGNLAGEAEYLSRFDGMNNTQIVTSIYQSLFGRNPDLTGLTFFVNGLNSGEYTINDIAIRILDGATGVDADLVAAKEAAADQFTAAVAADADFLAAYQGASGIALGQSFINQVTAADVEFTDAEVAAFIEAEVGAGIPGATFTLTTDVDAIVGTADNDTFQAIVGGADETVTTFDNVDGAGGTDTLNIVGDGAVAINANATIRNIEIVNVATDAAITDLNSASFQGVKQLWQIDGAIGDVTVGTGVVAGFRNGLAAVDVTAATGVQAVSIALDNADDASALAVLEAKAGDVKSVSVSGSVDGDFTVDTSATTKAATINLAVSSDSEVTLATTAGIVKTIDASASTGDLTIDATAGNVALTSVSTGSGADIVTVATAALTGAALDVNLGAGNDVLTLNAAGNAAATTVTITLGAGNDTVVLGAAFTNVTAADSFEDDLISITDFNAAQDVLNVSALGARDILVNTELANIREADTLEDALALAASYTTITGYSVFDYAGDAYILNNVAGAGFENGDGLLKIVGFSVEDITATNFVA